MTEPDLMIMFRADDKETSAWVDFLLASKMAQIASLATSWDGEIETTAIKLHKKD